MVRQPSEICSIGSSRLQKVDLASKRWGSCEKHGLFVFRRLCRVLYGEKVRNNKGKKIIKPAGSELMDYLNRGYAICNKCGAVMDRRRDPQGGCDIYTCPSCGWEIDEMDYEYEDGDEMELVLDERGDDRLIYRNDMPPAGCRACGGPYPNCKASCKMFGN